MSATPSQTRAEDRAAPPLSERTRSTRLRSVRARLLRLLGGAASLALTIAVIAGAGLAVLQGSAFLAERADAAAPPPEAPALPVATRPLRIAEGYEVDRRFLGEVAPRQATVLSFELGGQITGIAVDEGERVAEGAILARLDTALLDTEAAQLEAARAALEADLAFAERRLARQEELKDRGFSPDEALDEARASRDALTARIGEVEARLRNVRVRREKSLLRAPYDGVVAERRADTGATVAAGAPVLRLTETGTAEVRVGLPLWVPAETGTAWEVTVAGTTHAATLTALLPEIDPVTRTRTALLEIADAQAPFGAVAEVTVPQRIAARGAWVPRGALREGAPGVWTVLVVDDSETVRAAPVEVLHAEAGRVYVAGGLADGLALVIGGPHRVVPGQKVTPESMALAGGSE